MKTSFENLTRQETHFAFGNNWASYARSIGRPQIDEAVAGLSRLLGGERLDGKRFLDIGSGSGLHALAAFELGAAEVVALDIDPDSVETTRAVLALHAPGRPVEVAQASVFDLSPAQYGRFDVVYSWGVLHHTGDMLRGGRAGGRGWAIRVRAVPTYLDGPVLATGETLVRKGVTEKPGARPGAVRGAFPARTARHRPAFCGLRRRIWAAARHGFPSRRARLDGRLALRVHPAAGSGIDDERAWVCAGARVYGARAAG